MILEILGDKNLDFCKSVSVAIFGLITLKVHCIDHVMMAGCKVDKISTNWLGFCILKATRQKKPTAF